MTQIKDWKITIDLSKIKKFEDIQDITKSIMWPIVESMLKGEIDYHLGYSKHSKEWYGSWNSRNWSYQKTVHTSQWDMSINIPRDRNGDFEPSIIKKYSSNVWDLDERIINMMWLWLTSWEICKHLKEIYGADINKWLITTVSDKLIPEIKARQNRPLESFYPIVYLDAVHFKVKEWDRYINKATYVILWIWTNGIKDILWVYVWENESSSFRQKICTQIKNRWVEDILFASIDGLSGFSKAIQSNFPACIIQRCIVHQIRASTRYVSHKHKKAFIGDLKLVYKADTLDLAEDALLNLDEKRGKIYPQSVKSWTNNWDELSNYFAYTKAIRKLIYTTNPVESFNRQLRTATKKITVFPNDISLEKRLYLAAQNAKKKWNSPLWNRWIILWELVMNFWERVEKRIK